MTTRQKRIVFWGIVVIVIISFIGIRFNRLATRPQTLEMWGILDDPNNISSLLAKYHRLHPTIFVKYIAKNPETYNQDLLQAFASNKSPDLFMLPGNWLPTYKDKITPLNIKRDKVLNAKNLNELYPEVVNQELVRDGYLEGIPLYIDTLALYYNKSIFNYYNIALPPSSWEDVLKLVPRLRQITPQGKIKRAAIAIGTGHNTDWSSDILATLMMQKGSSVIDPQTKEITFAKPISIAGSSYGATTPGEEALGFYSQFANPRSRYYTWNSDLLSSLSAFTMGRAVMFIGYNQDQKMIKVHNPGLDYGIAPLPNFKGSLNKSNSAHVMTVVVSRHSAHQQTAWNLLKFLIQKNNAQYYFLQTKNPPARRDLIQENLNDPQVGVFISQILQGKVWYQIDFQKVPSIFMDMIDGVVRNNVSPSQAVRTAENRIYLLVQQNK